VDDFARVGRDLFLSGLVTTHGGNLSLRRGDRMLVTRRGAMLGHLTPEDLVETLVAAEGGGPPAASSETVVHRAVYRATAAMAVVHAHPPAAVFLSLLQEDIVPVDSEGAALLGRVPVVAPLEAVGSAESAGLVSRALLRHRAVVVRGHGSFAAAGTLEEALGLTSALEAASRILVLGRQTGADLGGRGPASPGDGGGSLRDP
jgi:L-fuculose-phosphate aldolase